MTSHNQKNQLFLEYIREYIAVFGQERNKSNLIDSIKNNFQIEDVPPITLTGILLELDQGEPQRYWDRQVMLEVSQSLSSFVKQDFDSFLSTFSENQDYLFLAINNYFRIIDTFIELEDIVYDVELKTKVFRNQIYSRICEECLMKFYKFFLNILTKYLEKDYSNPSTLNKSIEILKKNNFPAMSDINVNLRNAISHGDIVCQDHNMTYKYKDGRELKAKTISVTQYDDIINRTLDIAGGVIAGVLRFLVIESDFFSTFLSTNGLALSTEQKTRFEWLKIFLRTSNSRLDFFDTAPYGSSQANFNLHSSVKTKNKLLLSLISTLKMLRVWFPGYSRYYISYQHSRSLTGFISLADEDFQSAPASEGNKYLLQKAKERGECLYWDIQSSDVDEHQYKFFSFPTIEEDGWKVKNIEDCSNSLNKRIKGKLILKDTSINLEKIKEIVEDVIDKVKKLKTPENPQDETPYGEMHADAVFLNVFYKNSKRGNFDLFTSNQHFACSIQWYKRASVPKLKEGGVPSSLWNQYRHEILSDNFSIAWNPNSNNA